MTISNFTKDKSNVALSHGELSWGPSIKDVCNLILIGMRGDTFTSLSFLDQILSAEFLSKLSKHFEVKTFKRLNRLDSGQGVKIT